LQGSASFNKKLTALVVTKFSIIYQKPFVCVFLGKAEWSIVGTSGRHDSFLALAGDLVFIPRGMFHYFANADSQEELKVLIIFNSSQAVEEDDIGIVPSLNGLPIDILAASFGISEEYFKAIRKNVTQTPIILRKI
jgi:oxalate decarboxylase